MGSIRRGTAREARDTTINVRGGRNLKVTTLQIKCSEVIPEAWVSGTTKTLASTHATDLRILKCGQKILQECARPDHIVIREDGQKGSYLHQALDHLMAFTRFVNAKNLDLRLGYGPAEVLKTGDMVVGCDDDDGARLTLDAGLETVKELLTFSRNGRNYDCHVTGKNSRSFRERYRWERP